MRQISPQLRKAGLLAVVCAVVMTALAFMLVLPGAALADEAAVIAHSGEGSQRVNYTSVEDAKNAAYAGAVIVMDADWDFGENRLELSGKKSVSIDMNGHTISSSHSDSSINLSDGVSLRLFSSAQAKQFAYQGYGPSGSSWNWCDLTVTAAGLVTNTVRSSDGAKGINLKSGASLTTENIAVAGCSAAGIALGEGTTVTLNSTTVCHNWRKSTDGDGGAGIYVGPKSKVTLNASHVDENYSAGKGGGIFADSGANIFMENGSTVSGNLAQAGGGFYFNQSFFTLKSNDGTGVISNNKATRCDTIAANKDHSGGGIHVDASSGKNESVIEGLAIKGNYSAYDGGGIELDQRWTTVRNCTITDNCSKYDGGGIFVFGGSNTLENCTVTGNACNVDSGGNYEGGGVFVSYHYDVNLSGACVIKGNTRGKDSDNADDVFLGTVSGGAGKAYITGSLAKGSTVGVRTGYTSDRRIAKNFSSETKDGLFYDLDGYYVSYGKDEGGDAWQRHVNKEFALKVNGEVKARYKWKDSVGQVVPAFKGDDEVFWYWDDDATTGLNPISFYFNDDVRFFNALVISMPQNDVDAAAVYATRVKQVLVSIEAPGAGKELPKTAQVSRTDEGKGAKGSFRSAVTWYEVGEDGKASSVASAGVAKAGTAYVASVTCTESYEYGLHYSKSLSAGDVTVKTPSGGDGPEAESASVDGATGSLTVVTKAFAETDGEKTGAKDEKATVKMVDGGLEAGLGGASEAAAVAALSDDGAEAQSDGRAGLGEFDVSWTEGDAEVTIIAPAKAGYNFCNWEGARDWERDDVLGTVTVPYDEVGYIDQLVAVYTPVVTSAAVGLDAPEAGKALAETASDVKVTCSDADGTEVSFSELLDVDGFRVTWSPAGGTAGYSAAYTALVELADGAEDLVDVEKVVAAGATVTCNGTAVTAAGFTIVDGKLCLAVSFAKTRAVTAKSVSQPEAVEVSFEDAAAGNWQLPKTVLVTLENGEVVDADVEWEPVERFDAGATAAQELAVKGTIAHIAYDGELDAGDLDLNVSVAIKVAAPQKQASDEAKIETATTTTTTTKASKKGTPATGDVTWGGFAGLLAVAVVCLAAARISLRKDR